MITQYSDVRNALFEAVVSVSPVEFAPVSYTHLDVYKRQALEQAKRSEMLGIAKSELGEAAASPERAKRVEGSPTAADGAYSHDCGSCSSCKGVRAKLDSRHYVLGGALLSTAVFGFPVFCLVCPIGLTFATVLVVWRLFAAGDMTWSVVLILSLIHI